MAKHGFIVRAESEDAKQRPWKAAHRDTTQTFDPSNPESLPAISALGTAVVTQVSDRLNTFLAAAPTLPERAINRSLLAQMSLWLTDDEHDQLLTNIMDLVEDYRERNIDPDKRPVDALRNHYFLAATPELNAFTSPSNSDHSAEENS
ncbi:hypothetical protein [Timonella sp. A28]|uniref:hypothetical protein n=1 Tax=Timonella sp. A28 TaxID=3442640 RepID=UPI003EB77CFD